MLTTKGQTPCRKCGGKGRLKSGKKDGKTRRCAACRGTGFAGYSTK